MTTPLAITGLGLASSLGPAVTAAAAFRAGINRGQAQEGLPVDVPGEDGPAFVVGHTAWPYAEGYDQLAAWLRLARHGLEDLQTSLGENRWKQLWRDTAVIAALPAIESDRYGWSLDDVAPTLDQFFLQVLLARLGLSVPDDRRLVVVSGHAASAAALAAAREQIASGRWRRVVVLAVDTLLDPSSISWLQGAGRLKLPDQPHGLMPGEAAVALLLEAPGDTIGQPTGASILDAAVEAAPPPADDVESQREPPVASAQRLIAALNRVHPPAADPLAVDHYVDLNGEAWRAQVWGYAQPQVRSRLVADGGRVWYPAEGFGDTGAASGALACLLAVRSWARGYAGADQALIWSLAEDGTAGIIRLGRG